MTSSEHGCDPEAMVERLRRATNNHDLEAIVACFSPDYQNETPAHPERSFSGRDQVRKNWEHILAFIPDLTTDVLRCPSMGIRSGPSGSTEARAEMEHDT